MTSSEVGQHWRDQHHPKTPAPTRPADRTPVGAVVIAQLQGVVIAVHGVSASAALRELHWHSAQLNTSVADLAEGVMGSVGGRREAITPDVLGALLAGQPPPQPQRGPDANLRHPAAPLASVLHLVATDRPQPVSDAAERWTWEHGGLSRRESQVLRLIGEGGSNQDIAAAMFVTVNTVKSYIRAAYRKIGVTTRAQAVRWALMHEPVHQR